MTLFLYGLQGRSSQRSRRRDRRATLQSTRLRAAALDLDHSTEKEVQRATQSSDRDTFAVQPRCAGSRNRCVSSPREIDARQSFREAVVTRTTGRPCDESHLVTSIGGRAIGWPAQPGALRTARILRVQAAPPPLSAWTTPSSATTAWIAWPASNCSAHRPRCDASHEQGAAVSRRQPASGSPLSTAARRRIRARTRIRTRIRTQHPSSTAGFPQTLVDVFEWHLQRHPERVLITLYEDGDRSVDLCCADLHRPCADTGRSMRPSARPRPGGSQGLWRAASRPGSTRRTAGLGREGRAGCGSSYAVLCLYQRLFGCRSRWVLILRKTAPRPGACLCFRAPTSRHQAPSRAQVVQQSVAAASRLRRSEATSL